VTFSEKKNAASHEIQFYIFCQFHLFVVWLVLLLQIEEFLVNTESRLEAANNHNHRLQQDNQEANGSMSTHTYTHIYTHIRIYTHIHTHFTTEVYVPDLS